jgi:hypothetical protein
VNEDLKALCETLQIDPSKLTRNYIPDAGICFTVMTAELEQDSKFFVGLDDLTPIAQEWRISKGLWSTAPYLNGFYCSSEAINEILLEKTKLGQAF